MISFFFRTVKCGDIDKLGSFLLASWVLFFLTIYGLVRFSAPRFFRAIEGKEMVLDPIFAKYLVFWGVISFIIAMILSASIVGTMCGCLEMFFPAGTYAFAISSFSIGYGFMKAYQQLEEELNMK